MSDLRNTTVMECSGSFKTIRRPGKPAIKVLNLPDVRQATGYTCGVSSLQAVLCYYGVEYKESILAKMAGSSEAAGTPPEGLVKAVEAVNAQQGTHFAAQVRQHATVAEIEHLIDAETPVIVDIQAWKEDDNKAAWQDDWVDGHYVAAIGYDEQNLYFEDPSMLGSIGYIPKDEFLQRWHDFEGPEEEPTPESVRTHNLIVVVTGEAPAPPDCVLRLL